ncbi:LysR family transcriptional regulator [Flavobacteriaceae bacterium]|nr:LysR family transcriptional regulator [Flavobacteriaceae bacterium]
MGYQIKYKVWIETDEFTFLGNGRIRLLKTVQELGSLNKAAKALNISYKKAWDLIKSVNHASEEPLTTTTTGGSGGGGMKLTPYGIRMIAQYEALKSVTATFMDQQNFKN